MKKMDYILKRAMVLALLFVTVATTAPLIGFAQENTNVFAVVECMKVKQGDDEKYLDLEENFWKPMHQARVDQGKIMGWILYKVRYTGSDDAYNYVTVTVFNNPANLENPWAMEGMGEDNEESDMSSGFELTLKARELVKSSLIMRNDAVFPESGPAQFKYLKVNYMKVAPGNDGMYLEAEKNIWKPVHEQFVKAGQSAGWSLWTELFPSGYGLDYQYATVDYFSDFSQIGMADFNAAFKAAHPTGDMDELMKQTNDSRTLVRSELWEVLDQVFKQ